jgi:predicted DNA-binding ribbon-helix-helix protein
MPRNIYKGKRSNVTFPVALYEQIEKLAEKETISFSQMIVRLSIEAMAARNITVEPDSQE